MKKLVLLVAVLAFGSLAFGQGLTYNAQAAGSDTAAAVCLTPFSGDGILVSALSATLATTTGNPVILARLVNENNGHIYGEWYLSASPGTMGQYTQTFAPALALPINDPICWEFTNANADTYETVTIEFSNGT